ncbi:MAG: hypothetical protein ACT6FE_03615 [Methanosarcinaceae archaeon]
MGLKKEGTKMTNETGINKTVDELTEELKKIELQQKIIEAQKSTLKTLLPDSEVKTLEGMHTIDDNVAIECKILTYKAMSEIAFQISKEIKNIKKNIDVERIIIFNQDDFNRVMLYKTFIRQIQFLKIQYEEQFLKIQYEEQFLKIQYEKIEPILTPTKVSFRRMVSFVSPTAAVAAVPAMLKSFVDIASLFKVNTDIKGKKTVIDDEAVVAEIARVLNSVGITTIYPVFMNKIPDEVLEDLSELSGFKIEADTKIKEWNENESFADKVAFLENLNIQYEAILADLFVVDEKTGINRLETLIRGEMLSIELDKDNVYVLYLKVADSGGNNKVTRNLLHSRLSHSGGAIITYFLLSKEGIVETSKTMYNITDYTEFNNPCSIGKLNNF